MQLEPTTPLHLTGELLSTNKDHLIKQALASSFAGTLSSNTTILSDSLCPLEASFSHILDLMSSHLKGNTSEEKTLEELNDPDHPLWSNGEHLISILNTMPYLSQHLWELIDEHAECLQLTVPSVIQLNQTISLLLQQFVASCANNFIQHAHDNVLQFTAKLSDLSLPLIKITNSIGICPVIGEIDEQRASVLMEKALNFVKEQAIEQLIFDLSGVEHIDTLIAKYIFDTVNALELMGVHVVLTGLSTEIAMSTVQMGIQLNRLTVRQNLQQALLHLGITSA
ncbi:STAS domain-containing protein [Aureibacillus halotolerans]|uniref:Anti-anti-sigma regulatory factor n=1 Tax=Aureibacillus halotolerans TaxID=1508390 RepID=A0A4R6UAC3_9BACI|nr:STAS domain-containing protein [Aureibacillus halotolerans]TDQ42812.1 anti-anti-sigma regulatory factor [Aureibacillus halotolerans]